jgi:signal transduction histidine kinase
MIPAIPRRVLVAEDDPERLEAIEDRLHAAGFTVIPAQDGLEALDRAREDHPDAVVLNMLLRQIDGLRVCEILKANPATTNIPVVLVAGIYAGADEGQRALAAGADRFLAELGPLTSGDGHDLGSGQDLVQALVLVIDDDPDNRAFLMKAVSRQGFETVTASGMAQAQRLLDGRQPALVFLDVQMPGESGLALLPQFQRDFPESVTVMMTAFGSEQVAADALRGGADDYIGKPIELPRLRELLERNLEKQRLRAERMALLRRLKESNRYLVRQHAALRRADQEIMQVNRQLEQSNRFKSEFLANMSHELRTPLNAILGFSEILLDASMELSAGERVEFLRNIRSSGQHLLNLINDILDLAKIEAGKMDLHPEEMSVLDAIHEVTSILEPMARQQGLRLVGTGLAPVGAIRADKSKFKQVLYNLLSNAIKFTPPPGTITLEVRDELEQVSVSVSDTGIGIKEEDLPKLFREFQQLDGSYTRRYEGTGLGLALCRRFVEMHGGRIWVQSQPGRGSTFTFTLPRQAKLPQDPAPEAPTPPELMDRPLVLVVEDDPLTSQRLTSEIQAAGFQVAHARDGEEALRKAIEILPDLITIETVLPRKDGWEVLQELRRRAATSDIPVLICSVTENQGLAAKLGVTEYVAKPWATKTLQEALQRLAQRVTRRRDRVRLLILHQDRKAIAGIVAGLVEEGFEVFRADSVEEAKAKAEAAPPDALVLAPPHPDWVRFVAGIEPQPVLLAVGQFGPEVPAMDWAAVIPDGFSDPRLVLHAVKGLEIVQQRRRSGRERRQGTDRRG